MHFLLFLKNRHNSFRKGVETIPRMSPRPSQAFPDAVPVFFCTPFVWNVKYIIPLIDCPIFASIYSMHLSFTGFLCIAGHNLDLIGRELMGVFAFKFDIFDEKSPDIVAKAICFKVTL